MKRGLMVIVRIVLLLALGFFINWEGIRFGREIQQHANDAAVLSGTVIEDGSAGNNCRLLVNLKGTFYTVWAEGADYVGARLLHECSTLKPGDRIPITAVSALDAGEIFEWKGLALLPPLHTSSNASQ